MKGVDLFDAGFTDLVSVIPVNAELSHNSNISEKSRGKVPGRKNSTGRWAGYPWLEHAPKKGEVVGWDQDGANIGIKAEHFPAVDIDVTDAQLAADLTDVVVRVLGDAPSRQGRAPKNMLIYRTDETVNTTRLRFADTETGVIHLVEVLGKGAQYVVVGTHPATKKLYQVDEDLIKHGPEGLNVINQESVNHLMNELSELLSMYGFDVLGVMGSTAKDRKEIDQNSLAAKDMGQLEQVMAKMPNDYTDRETYIQFGYAIKAASQNDPGRGLAVFLEWCDRWEGGDNDPSVVESDWMRMHPPFEIGMEWILKKAQEQGIYEPAWDFTAEPVPEDGPEQPSCDPAVFSESAVAQRFARKHAGRIRSVPDQKQWYVWDGARWKKDTDRTVWDMARQYCDGESARALRILDPVSKAESVANALARARFVDAVLQIACGLRSVVTDLTQFDQDEHLINTPLAVYDLRDGDWHEHRPDLWQSRMTPIAPSWDMPTPSFDKFMDEITQGDTGLREYLQRLAGYAMAGTSREQMFAFLFGPGGNGKGVFVRLIARVLGDEYSAPIPASSVTNSRFEKQTSDLAGLLGMRFVYTDETDDDDGWDEQRLKVMTGGDTIKARFLYGNFFTYTPQFTLVISSNHAPSVKNVTEALKRRMHICPFEFIPQRRDAELEDRLAEELPGIMAWMIDGAIAWYANGLEKPQIVEDATVDYLTDQDDMGRWLDTNVTFDPSDERQVEASTIFTDYSLWCTQEGLRPMSQRKFGSAFKVRMKSMRCQALRHPKTRRVMYQGVQLREDQTFNVVPLKRSETK